MLYDATVFVLVAEMCLTKLSQRILLTWAIQSLPYQEVCSSSPHKASLQSPLTLELESVENECFQLTVATGIT